jgi:hypothetical protein
MKVPNYLKHLTAAVLISLFVVSCEKEDEKIEPIVKTSLTFSEIYTTNNEDISDVEIKENSIYVKDTKKLTKWHGVLLEEDAVEAGANQIIEYTITKQTDMARVFVGYILNDDIDSFKIETTTNKYEFVYSQIYNLGVYPQISTDDTSMRIFGFYNKNEVAEPFFNYELGDRFKIELSDKKVKYYINDILIYTDINEVNQKATPAISFTNAYPNEGEIQVSEIKISKY